MGTTEVEPVPTAGRVRPRLPQVAGILAGVVLLSGIVLVWTASLSDRNSPAGSVRGAMIPAAGEGRTLTGSSQVVRTAAAAPAGIGPSSPQPPEVGSNSPDFERAILGTWTQYSHGHRTLNVQEGGKATIDVKLDGLSAIAFGEKLRIDIEWTIDGKTLLFNTTGGTPESSINAVKSLYGDNRVYQILDINEKQMLLKEGDEEKTPWDRVEK